MVMNLMIYQEIYSMKQNTQFIVRPSQIQAQYGMSRANAYRLMNLGQFPPLLQLSERTVGWSKGVLDKHFGLTD